MKKFKIKINGSEYEVDIHKVEGNLAHLTVNEVDFDVEIEGLKTNPTRMSTKPAKKPEASEMQSSTPVVKPHVVPTSAHVVKSPLPGVILDIRANVGDSVKVGQVIMVLEAMKMENNIEADRAGVIEKVNPGKGDSVLEGDVLFTIK